MRRLLDRSQEIARSERLMKRRIARSAVLIRKLIIMRTARSARGGARSGQYREKKKAWKQVEYERRHASCILCWVLVQVDVAFVVPCMCTSCATVTVRSCWFYKFLLTAVHVYGQQHNICVCECVFLSLDRCVYVIASIMVFHHHKQKSND